MPLSIIDRSPMSQRLPKKRLKPIKRNSITIIIVVIFFVSTLALLLGINTLMPFSSIHVYDAGNEIWSALQKQQQGPLESHMRSLEPLPVSSSDTSMHIRLMHIS
jgi:hypothetical protein